MGRHVDSADAEDNTLASTIDRALADAASNWPEYWPLLKLQVCAGLLFDDLVQIDERRWRSWLEDVLISHSFVVERGSASRTYVVLDQVGCREAIVKVLRNLGGYYWKLAATPSLRGGPESYCRFMASQSLRPNAGRLLHRRRVQLAIADPTILPDVPRWRLEEYLLSPMANGAARTPQR